MSTSLRQTSASAPSQKVDSYIYAITPTYGNNLAAITSADELLLLDRQNLNHTPSSFPDIPTRVTSLATGDESGSVIICAGLDGVVAAFDLRSPNQAMRFRPGIPITALACHGTDLVLGTEVVQQQATVAVWDLRQQKQRWQNAENSDDITTVKIHPSNSHLVLSGGDEGIVSIFDTRVREEDDSLVQAVNHSPIHQAGFLDEAMLYALSADEQLSVHQVTAGAGEEDESSSEAIQLGDLRPLVGCEYVIDITDIGGNKFIAAGSHNINPHINLVPITPQGKLRPHKKLTILGAHGEDVVRDIYGDFQTESVFTCGEDGYVRSFRAE